MAEKKCLFCKEDMPPRLTNKGVIENRFAHARRSYCSKACSVQGKAMSLVSVADQLDNYVPFAEMARRPWR